MFGRILRELLMEAYVFMAFAAAEFEDSGIVAHKGNAFGGVAGLGAEITRLDPVAKNQYNI